MIPTLLESGILAFFFCFSEVTSFVQQDSTTMKKFFLSMFIITKSSIKY